MKCIKCNDREAKGKTELCDPCRLKKWRKDNPEKVRVYNKMRYRRDREELLSKNKAWRQKNGYADCKTPKSMENTRIKRKTRYWHPIGDNTCQLCDKPAKHHHHTTVPLEVDKFMFLCKKHHDEIHGKQCVVENAKCVKRGQHE